ncbi:MAG: FHA domain-containing protein [Bdellovibrionota bacterium]
MKGSSHYYLYDHRSKLFHELKNGFVVGRMEGDLKFPGDDLMSRSHFRFFITGNDLYIEDLRSTNQTRVNTVGIRSSFKRRIQLNDLIECGVQRFTLTHQNKYPPANIEDKTRAKKVYKAKKLEGGGLEAQNSKIFTKLTLVVLDRYRYHALRIKKAFAPDFLNYKNKNAEKPRKKGVQANVPMIAGVVLGLVSIGLLFGTRLVQASRTLAIQHCQGRSETSICQGFIKRGWISISTSLQKPVFENNTKH